VFAVNLLMVVYIINSSLKEGLYFYRRINFTCEPEKETENATHILWKVTELLKN